MDLAIAKAKNVGVAWVTCTGKLIIVELWHFHITYVLNLTCVVLSNMYTDKLPLLTDYVGNYFKGSNHYGMACYYTQRAAENGLIVSCWDNSKWIITFEFFFIIFVFPGTISDQHFPTSGATWD